MIQFNPASDAEAAQPKGIQFDYTPPTESVRMKYASGSPVARQEGFLPPWRKDVNIYKPCDGENHIRILPPTWNGAEWFGYEIFIHYGIGGQSVLSLSKHQNASDDPLAGRKLHHRFGYWLIDRKNQDAGILFWAAPAEKINGVIAAEMGNRLVDCPINGHDIFFEKSGTGKKTRYTGVRLSNRPTPLHHDREVAQRCLDAAVAHPVPTVLQFNTVEQIKKLLDGESSKPAPTNVVPLTENPF